MAVHVDGRADIQASVARYDFVDFTSFIRIIRVDTGSLLAMFMFLGVVRLQETSFIYQGWL